MKTYNFNTKTRQALRSLVKLMKQQGLNPVSNEKTRKSDHPWQCKLVTGSATMITTEKKRFNVVNGIAVPA